MFSFEKIEFNIPNNYFKNPKINSILFSISIEN